MSKIRSMTAFALAAGVLYTWTRAVREAARSRRAAANAPDRHVLERPELHNEGLERYQDLLDESLHLTFPASDPISAQAATRCGDRVETQANPADWQLHPGSMQSPEVSPAGR